jgi:hypothetical protein
MFYLRDRFRPSSAMTAVARFDVSGQAVLNRSAVTLNFQPWTDSRLQHRLDARAGAYTDGGVADEPGLRLEKTSSYRERLSQLVINLRRVWKSLSRHVIMAPLSVATP